MDRKFQNQTSMIAVLDDSVKNVILPYVGVWKQFTALSK